MIIGVTIYPSIAQGHVIQWTTTPTVPPNYKVELYRSYDSVVWSPIGTVTDGYFFLDHDLRVPNRSFKVFYKLVANGEFEYVVSSFIGALPKKDRLYIKAIQDKHRLLCEKRGGRPGFLLKRRDSQRCSACQAGDPGPDCPVCGGLGYFGGFYRAVPYGMITVSPSLKTTTKTSGIGSYSSSKDVTKGLVYPAISEGDVWVEKFTDRRYFITGKEELQFNGIPIIYNAIELSLIPANSEIYKIRVG